MGGCRRPDPIDGSSSDQTHGGACRSEGFLLGEDVPDGLGQLAGDVDASDLGATLATETPSTMARPPISWARCPCRRSRAPTALRLRWTCWTPTLIAGLDSDGELFLPSGYKVQVAPLASVTAAKTVTVVCIGGDY